MPTKCLNLDVLGVSLADRGWAVIGFQDMAEIVIVDEEKPRVGGVDPVPPILGECRVTEANPVPAPAVGLKNATRRRCRDNREVGCGLGPRIPEAVETPAHIGEREGADQTLADVIPLERRERGIFGRQFCAIVEFEPPGLQGLVVVKMIAPVKLFRKKASAVNR